MVYGNLFDSKHTNINIGNWLQFMAISWLYKCMGISEEEICYVDLADVMDYNGERMILPINYSIFELVKNGRIEISDHITPVFIALRLDTVDTSIDIDAFLSDEYNRNYLLKHSPVGCRDIVSYRHMIQYGIPAYVNGCMTATFPRYSGNKGDKIIFADTPITLLPYIPDKILNQSCEVTTQQYYFAYQDVKEYHNIYEFVKSKYDYYMENAKLIITSRLHVALPCTAFGIPVILAKDYMDARFDFVSHYLPLYDREQYAKINWCPEAIDYEPLKQQLIAFAAERIRSAAKHMQTSSLLTSIFLDGTCGIENYSNPYKVFHRNGYRFQEWAAHYKNKNFKSYALWGIQKEDIDYWEKIVHLEYPEVKLAAIFDKYKKGEMLGIELQSPDEIENLLDDAFVIVCAASATTEARCLFQRLGWKPDRYCIVADCFIAQENLHE